MLRYTTQISKFSLRNHLVRDRGSSKCSRQYNDQRYLSSSSDKEARRLGRVKLRVEGPGNARGGRFFVIGSIAVLTGVACVIYDVKQNPSGLFGSLYSGSPLEKLVNYLHALTWGNFNEMMEPAIEKAIPDWGDPIYGNAYPPGLPPPPLLVLDLERTIIGSEHSAKYGWRHVKRPGLDKFLEQLRQYYEIVIFSENDIMAQQELLMEIDKENCTHKLGPSAAELRGTLLLKRLDVLNRDERRILIIDDDPEAVQLCPRNALIIKPYTDIRDKSDRILLDLIPLLQAVVHEDGTGQRDIRELIDSLGTRDAHEAAIEYQLRVAKRLQQEEELRNRGLGGVIRQTVGKVEIDEVIQSQKISADRLIGMSDKPDMTRLIGKGRGKTKNAEAGAGEAGSERGEVSVVKKKGLLWQAQEDRERVMKEAAERKQMAMQTEYMNRMRLKAEQEERKRSQESSA